MILDTIDLIFAVIIGIVLTLSFLSMLWAVAAARKGDPDAIRVIRTILRKTQHEIRATYVTLMILTIIFAALGLQYMSYLTFTAVCKFAVERHLTKRTLRQVDTFSICA